MVNNGKEKNSYQRKESRAGGRRKTASTNWKKARKLKLRR